MEDISRRVTAVEAGLAAVREQVVHVREKVAEMNGRMEQFATKADMKDMELRLIKWIVGTGLTGIILGVAQFLTRLSGP